jgi:hypothetical protein
MGFVVYVFVWPSRALGIAAAIGAFAAADRLGLMPPPYDPSMRDLLHPTTDDSRSRLTAMGFGPDAKHASDTHRDQDTHTS